MRGFYFVIEGMDGSGKTTQVDMLGKRLDKEGYDVVLTTEPTKFNTGLLIRELIAKREHDEREEAVRDTFAWFADRVNHNMRTIKPSLKEGKIVVSDRNYQSTIAYQGSLGADAKGFVIPTIDFLKKGDYINTPDLTIILDIPMKEYERRMREKKNLEKFEATHLQEIIRDEYLKMKSYLPNENIVVLNGMKGIEELGNEIYEKNVLKLMRG